MGYFHFLPLCFQLAVVTGGHGVAVLEVGAIGASISEGRSLRALILRFTATIKASMRSTLPGASRWLIASSSLASPSFSYPKWVINRPISADLGTDNQTAVFADVT